MNKIDKIMKNRMIFIIALSEYLNNTIRIDERFITILNMFAVEYTYNYFKELSLIMFYSVDENNNLIVVEPDNILHLYKKYTDDINDPRKLCKIYDDVGFCNTQIISDFALVFIDYLNNYEKRKSKFKQ